MSDVPAQRSNVMPISAGRPVGSRNLISRRILEDIAAAWHEHGADCLRILAKEDPGKFAQLGVAILPRDFLVSVEQRAPGGLSPDDWATVLRVLEKIRTAVPASADASPGEVFAVIEAALQAHYNDVAPVTDARQISGA